MCCVDCRLVHYRILGRHTTYVSEIVPFQQILVKRSNLRVVMKVQTLLDVLYFKQGVRQYCAGDKIEKNEMGWACDAYG